MSRLLTLRRLSAGSTVFVAILAFSVTGAGARDSLVAYNVYPLISDSSAVSAPLTDTSLLNGWGLSASATSPWWTANNKSNTSTLYTRRRLEDRVDRHRPGRPDGHRRKLEHGRLHREPERCQHSSRFLFDTQGGQLLGWTPTVNGTAAVTAVDNSSKGAVYDGLTTLNDRLYAADFHNAHVDSFDASFKPLALGSPIRRCRRAGRRSESRR